MYKFNAFLFWKKKTFWEILIILEQFYIVIKSRFKLDIHSDSFFIFLQFFDLI